MERERINIKTEYKFKLIKDYYNGNFSIDDFCNENKLKRRTFYRWLKQFNENS